MSMIRLTFERYLCRDCGLESPGAVLQSVNTCAPPPTTFTYDGSCIHCGSDNTEELTGILQQNQNDQL